jgi:hypothetical protein
MGAPAQKIKVEDDDGEEEQTRIAAPGALAGAFSAAVSEHVPASVADPLNMPGDEWFVGINGVPVGPIRLSELRTKAASGAITKESLVWRDGFEEWRPLKSFPELAAIVEEGLSSTRASLPNDPAGATAASSATPGTGRVGTLADPFGSSGPQAVSATSGAAVTGAAVVTDDADAAGLRRRSGTSPAAWLAIVVAMLFGITLGSLFLGRSQPVTEKAEKPAESSQKPAQPAPAAAKQDSTPDETVVTPDAKAVSKGSGGMVKTATKTESDSKLTGGLKGLGLSGLAAGGPKGPGENSGSSPAAGGQLDQTQLQSTVARYTPSVKRGCWQPALDARDKDAPGSARVSVAITISPSGSVQDVSVNGGDPRGYRGLASCIAGRVRGWQFPASGGITTVNVPFVFVAQ